VDQFCNTSLSQDLQQPTDKWLVALVRIERLAQTMHTMKTSRKQGGLLGVPLSTIVLGFSQQINNLKEYFSADLVADRKYSAFHVYVPFIVNANLTLRNDTEFLQHHLLTLDLMLYEAAIPDPSFNPVQDQDRTMNQAGAVAIGYVLDAFGIPQESTKARIDLLNACLASVKALLGNYMSHVDAYMRLSYIFSFDMNYCFKLCRCLTELGGIAGWELSSLRKRLGLDDELMKMHIEDLMNLTAVNNSFETVQSSQNDDDEDEDADLLPMRRDIKNGVAKHPFQNIANDLKSLLFLFNSEEGGANEKFASSDVATSKAYHKNRNTGQRGRDHTTRSDIGGQEPRSVQSQDGTEPFWQTAAPLASSASERTGDERSTVPSTKDGSSQSPAIPTEAPYFFPGGGFSQISFWPRLVRREN
jgi:hypothetical protein